MLAEILLVLGAVASAAPSPRMKSGVSLPLRAPRRLSAKDSPESPYRRSLTNVDLTNWQSGYTVEVEVGTPPQKFDIMVDTGSSAFWVIGTCDNSTECSNATLFRSSASSTFEPTTRPFVLSYGDGGRQSGTWGWDQVGLAGSTYTAGVAVSNETVKWESTGMAYDGIMGFMHKWDPNEDLTPWWAKAILDWDAPLFGMHLGREPPDSGARQNGRPSTGELTFGGVNTSLFKGDITYYDVINPEGGHWSLPLRVSVGGKIALDNMTAVIDSGSSHIYVPDKVALEFHEALPVTQFPVGSGGFLYKAGTPLNAGFDFGDGKVWALDDDDMCAVLGDRAFWQSAGAVLSEDGDYCLSSVMGQSRFGSGDDESASGTAKLQTFPRVKKGERAEEPAQGEEPEGPPEWIIGANFMKNVYTVFRLQPLSVGFAELTPEANKKYPEKNHTMEAEPTAASSAQRLHFPSFALLALTLAVAW